MEITVRYGNRAEHKLVFHTWEGFVNYLGTMLKGYTLRRTLDNHNVIRKMTFEDDRDGIIFVTVID